MEVTISALQAYLHRQYGDWADELESFAKLMGIQTIRI